MTLENFSTAKVGDELPPATFGPVTRGMLALYAGASGDHNPIHIDSDFAKQAGLPDVFAQGMLSFGGLAQVVTKWAGIGRLRSFGARNVAILDGGLAKWIAEGRPLSTEAPETASGHFTPLFRPEAVRSIEQMRANVTRGDELVVDARGAKRFSGEEADPRPEVASGHIPGSHNLPYDRLFNPDGTWKRGDALKAVFDEAGIDLNRPMVTTCGSGVTAAVLLFGAALLGKEDVALYDGSWSEWGTRADTPKATTAA